MDSFETDRVAPSVCLSHALQLIDKWPPCTAIHNSELMHGAVNLRTCWHGQNPQKALGFRDPSISD